MRRVAAVVLPFLRVELARAGHPELARAPVAVVVTEAAEHAVSGNTRLREASAEATACGVRDGMTLAQARARCAELRVRVLREAASRDALAALAEALYAFGATTSIWMDRDTVLVDVTGCAHLHGGEAALLAVMEARVALMGHACRTAIAPGPEIAWAVATFGVATRVVVDDAPRAARALPVAALRLDEPTHDWLRKLGIRTLWQMQRLPRASLGTRLGERAPRVFALLDGDDRTPLAPHPLPEVLEERVELEWALESLAPLLFVLKTLCDRVAARLLGRAALAARLEVVLELDRAMVAEGASRTQVVGLGLAAPVHGADDLLAVLRARMEKVPLTAPVLAVVLRAPELVARKEQTRDLFLAESRARTALPRLVAELAALLGDDAVGTLAIVDSHVMDERSSLLPPGSTPPARTPFGEARLVFDAPEPLRLLPARARSRPRAGLRVLGGVVRLEHVAWWRGRPEAAPCDWVLAWDPAGALALVRMDGEETRVWGYFD